MASEGPNDPSAASESQDSGNEAWSNETNVYSEDGNYAYAMVGTTACFIAGTSVKIPYGYINIEKLAVGDDVVSFNENDETSYINSKVVKLFSRNVNHYFILKTPYRTVKVTGKHRFFTKTGFVRVIDMKPGDRLMTESGEETLVSITRVDENAKVYNHSLSSPWTYIANGFLVHNVKPF